MDADWYREVILDRYKNPLHRGELTDPTVVLDGVNPACGDNLKLSVKIGAANTIEDMQIQGEGCAIALVAADMVAEQCIGQSLSDVAAMTEKTVFDLLGGEVAPARRKCALLAFNTIHSHATKTVS